MQRPERNLKWKYQPKVEEKVLEEKRLDARLHCNPPHMEP